MVGVIGVMTDDGVVPWMKLGKQMRQEQEQPTNVEATEGGGI